MQPWQGVNPMDIPSEIILQHPIVAELSSALELKTGVDVSIPYVIKNAILMSPGKWNGYLYNGAVISNAFKNTNWKQKEVRALYLDHKDKEVPNWVGEVQNERMEGNNLIGDLYLFDLITAIKLATGKPRFGISPKVAGNEKDGTMKEYVYENFSIVINPACKTTYLNSERKEYDGIYINQEVGNMPETELEAEPVMKSELADPIADKAAADKAAAEAAKKKEYPLPIPKEEKKTDEMSDFRTLLKELASLVEQLKCKPAVAGTPEVPKEKMEEKEMSEMKTVITEMKAEIKELKGEPEKLNVKAFELADKTSNGADEAMLKFLQEEI